MPNALNLAAPIKQDPESQAQLQGLIDTFSQTGQPLLDAALSKSEIVHYARVVVLDNRYMLILTEFDGDPFQYTEFFRTELGPLFQSVFSLIEGAPSWEELNDPNSFFEYMQGLDKPSLGTSTVGNEGRGFLFSSFGDATVREIKAKLGSGEPQGAGTAP